MSMESSLAAGVGDLRDQLAVGDLIIENASDAIFLLDAEGRTTFANPAAERIFGWTAAELIGRRLHDLVHYKHPDGSPFPIEECPLGQVLETGTSLRHHEDTFFCKDGTAIGVACSNGAITRDGVVTGGVLVIRDISDRLRAAEHNQLLVGELTHRVKNTLAVVQAIAHQSLQGDDLPAARAKFDARLAALAAAHDLLTRTQWSVAPLREIVASALAPFGAGQDRWTIAGEEVSLPPEKAVALSIALHELATNATKYGALSTAAGRIAVSWQVAPAKAGERLRLVWQESGGPPVAMPARAGFGSRMIERALAAELDGTASIEFRPEGLTCTVDCPRTT